jgi:hypothetical protein
VTEDEIQEALDVAYAQYNDSINDEDRREATYYIEYVEMLAREQQ